MSTELLASRVRPGFAASLACVESPALMALQVSKVRLASPGPLAFKASLAFAVSLALLVKLA